MTHGGLTIEHGDFAGFYGDQGDLIMAGVFFWRFVVTDGEIKCDLNENNVEWVFYGD